MRVRWTPIPGAREYEVFRSSSPDGPWLVTARTSGREILDRNVRPGERYYYKVAPALPGSLTSSAASAEPSTMPDERLVALGSAPAAGGSAAAVLARPRRLAGAGSLSVVDIFDPAEPVVAEVPLASPSALAASTTHGPLW